MSYGVLLTADKLTGDNPFITPSQSFFKTLIHSKVISFALALSIIAHTALFIRINFYPETTSQADNGHSLIVSLNRVTPDAPTVPEQKIKDEKQIKPPKPENIIEKKIQPEKVIKTVEKKSQVASIDPEKKIEPVNKEQQYPKELVQPIVQTNSSATAIKQARENYIQQLATHINKHKFYPRTARRRNIEGQVNVSFDLLTNGNIINLHVHSGPAILQKAAMKAIHSALPMPRRPDDLLNLDTMKIEYAIQFSLK